MSKDDSDNVTTGARFPGAGAPAAPRSARPRLHVKITSAQRAP